ncbi:nitroreductase family deazaflavin-dependent oxidoreductase [Nocardia arthritidis]|uniref:Nitroreductase family deazaflavin-dependent oxidoreductase n=1 Tax=Nocardia arthritidis TaxID=228602 RepID=A0A6G9YH96_9NOCA|nr:nitroreductase family deazaflavin-dependent oxidoreductase [Nocardia arthritidis]QIS12520.1 nitroreductase family deazaflavin-dependent oxidoreductase [Nocardia arthritidis]
MTLGYHHYLRWLYRTGRPNLFARIQNHWSARFFAAGIWPRRVAALGISGRRSGRTIWFPVVITEFEGARYIVSMLGDKVNWVRNLTVAHGHAELRHGIREKVCLVPVPPEQRAPILWRYLEVAPGARPHIPVAPNAAPAEFERIAADYPVFRIESEVPGAQR